MKEKRGNKKILVAIALLLLLSVCFTTYAIYRSTANAEAKVQTAAWSVKLDGTDMEEITETVNIEFAATDCTLTNGRNGKIAPGDTCTKTIEVDASGSEVDVIVEATKGTVTPTLPSDFTVDVTVPNSGKISYAATMKANVTVTLTWGGAISDDAGKDTADKAIAAQTIKVPITLTARQQVSGN